jgi:YbbR domain-containing protein
MKPGGTQREGWQRRITAAFTQRLALKASAVLLALVLWFVVAARQPTEEVAMVKFAPQLDSALVLKDPAPPIRAYVIGRPSEILKLGTSPLMMRRGVSSDAPDTLTVSLHPADVEVPEGVQVIVREIQPRTLTLRFEPTSSRRVPVRSAIMVRATNGRAAAMVRLEPESVTVLGPRRSVALLQYVSTRPDSISIDTVPHLVDIDTAGLGVAVRPAQVKATFLPRSGAPRR